MNIKASEYTKKYAHIVSAVEKANKILMVANATFTNDVESIKHFTYTTDDGFNVLANLIASRAKMVVYLYKTRNPWSKVLGYTKGKDIYINERNINRSAQSLVETFVHESMHVLGYTHGGNSVRWYNRNKKMNSVPYLVGRLAGAFK